MVSILIAKRVLSFSHALAVRAKLSACLLAIAMLLSFPVAGPHNFRSHYRSPEVRGPVVRHTVVSAIHGHANLRLTPSAIEPVLAIRARPRAVNPSPEREIPERVSIVQKLHRLKLGPHSDGDPVQLL